MKAWPPIHALHGNDGWLIQPHIHLVVTGLGWRRDRRHGKRHPGRIGHWRAQRRLELAWRHDCATARTAPALLDIRSRDPRVIDGTAR